MMPAKLENSDPYVIGFDLGNQTVASSVINGDFNVVRKNGVVMDHVNLFSRGDSKAERRVYRSTRRGISHKKWLKKQMYRFFLAHQIDGNIQEIQRRFKTSWISKKDQNRLDQKSIKMLYLLQKKLYPTVWFAAKALIENDVEHLPQDVRGRESLIYEVFHNLLSRRGHFLMPGLKVDAFMEQVFDFGDLLGQFRGIVQNNLGLDLGDDTEVFKAALTMNAGIMKRKDALLKAIQNNKLFSTDKQRIKTLANLCAGGKVSAKQLAKLFNLKDEAAGDLQLGSSTVDDQLDKLNGSLSDSDFAVVEVANKVYYQGQLSMIQKPGKSFVDSQIDNFYQFGKDLVLLEKTILPALQSAKDRAKYADILKRYLDSEGQVSAKYRKMIYQTGSDSKSTAYKPLTQNDFVEATKKLKKAKFIKPLDQLIGRDAYERLGGSRFLFKTSSVQNAWIPEQAIQSVVRQIIDTQKHVSGLEWLGEQNYADPWFGDEHYDLERFFDFRIPYYVGPLVQTDDQSEFAWLKRNESGTLTVFNFTKKVDMVGSARNFILNLQAADTYLLDEPVMPASSMTYQKYTVLDELNHLSIKTAGRFHKLSTDQKMALLDLFKQTKTVSLVMAVRCLQTEFNVLSGVNPETDAWRYLKGLSQESDKLEGNKAKFNNNLSTYLKWKDQYGFSDQQIEDHYDDLEQIAEYLTVFDQDSKLIKKTVLQKFAWLTDDQIDRLSKDNLDGWGRLSKKLLTGIYDDDHHSVLDLMTDTSMSFVQAVTQPVIKEQINKHQEKLLSHQSSRRAAIDALLDRSYASPTVRKVIQRFASHLMGIIKQMRYVPSIIVIESAREDGVGQTNTTRVAKQIEKLVDQMDDEIVANWKSLSSNEKKKLSLKQRLYFEQNGRDIYTGRLFNFNHLSADTHIDHVIPQHLYKDNSLANKVLTFKDENMTKGGTLCATQVVTGYGRRLWKELYQHGLMSAYKYKNLQINWNDPQSGKQMVGMLRRSLVETHQVNKLAAQVSTMLLQNKGTKVLTMRADVTSLLRENSDFKDTKVRSANDLHHGVDAFLVAFAGQYLWKKYSYLHPILDYNDYSKVKLPPLSMRQIGFKELFNDGPDNEKIFNKDTGEILGTRGHLKNRINNFNQNTINVNFEHGLSAVTAGGTIANATIYAARKLKPGQNYLPVQGHDPEIYGYRQSITNRKMALVKLLSGKNVGNYQFVTIPYNFENRIDQYVDSQIKEDYEILRKDLFVFDEFTIPGTKLRFAANGRYFVLHTEMHYSNDLLRRIHNKKQLNADQLKRTIKDIVVQVKKQYAYMIKNDLGSNFKKLGQMDLDKELAKETDIDHLRELVDDLIVGYNCSKDRRSFKIGDMKFSFVGLWTIGSWPNVKMSK